MNILIVNGSPRKTGLISQMLDIMREDAESRGDKVQMVYSNDLSIKPCIGCMACRTKLKCSIAEDDSQRVLKMIQEADAIIMGAPCYWGNIPGQMKLLFDRIVYGMMRDTPRFPEPLMKGKKWYHPMALEYLVQTVTRCHPCYARDMSLFRHQDCRNHRTWRYSHATATIRERQTEMS